MTGAMGNYKADMETMARLENQLAAVLGATAEEVDHMECFDEEQRAEIYTILQTLKTDTSQHRALLGRWVRQSTETGNA